MGRGNESLFTGSWSHVQVGSHAHIWVKTLKESSSPEPEGRFPRNLVCSILSSPLYFIQMMTLG